MKDLAFIREWRVHIVASILTGSVPKTLIVNVEDLTQYEDALQELYPHGIIPVLADGRLRYKGIPLGISDQLKRGECALEI